MDPRNQIEDAEQVRFPYNLDGFRKLAKEKLPSYISDYIDGGACDELTVKANRHDFDRIHIAPLCMRDVAKTDISITLLSHSFQFPIGFSPTAFHRLVLSDGELATSSAARALNIPMLLSSMSSVSMENVATHVKGSGFWFQTYIFRERSVTRDLLQRAEQAGYQAVVLTVGVPVPGIRDRNLTNQFTLPAGVAAANFGLGEHTNFNNPIYSVPHADLDPSLTWRDLDWLRNNTTLPIILKGIMNHIDVRPAIDAGISGLIISNHGGRQLDTTESTINILPSIATEVAGRVPILIDGGFRRGTDVLKALALGATCVLLGRPVFWALAVGGESGLIHAVNCLADELRTAMQIAGCSTLSDLQLNAEHILRIM